MVDAYPQWINLSMQAPVPCRIDVCVCEDRIDVCVCEDRIDISVYSGQPVFIGAVVYVSGIAKSSDLGVHHSIGCYWKTP